MPWCLKRYQEARCLHFITFSCYRRAPLLASPEARRVFEETLERVRKWYGIYVAGYVVMPEHVHLLVSEPECDKLSVVIQMLKQNVAHQLKERPRPVSPKNGETRTGHPWAFWYARYYDFNVWSEEKRIEKLRYIHRNPVKRGLVERPEDWEWSSFRHHVSGIEGIVEIESQWTARKRENLGMTLQPVPRQKSPPCLSTERRDEDGAPSGIGRRIVYSQPVMPKLDTKRLKMFLVPCSCGTTFAVSADYDRQGTAWSRYLKCPGCGKRHDPKNRLLELGYQREGYWKVDAC